MATLKKLGDRLLGRMLGSEDAGACVWNYFYTCGCTGGFQKLIDCNGVCRRTQFAC